MKRTPTALWLALALLGLPGAVAGQGLMREALEIFPAQTVRLEYSSPAKLRTLPNYTTLRQRYAGARLNNLKDSLSQLGVQESDVDELVMGWEADKAGLDLFGLAAGRFDAKAVSDNAAAHGLTPAPVSGKQAYCLGGGESAVCMAVLGETRGVFVSLSQLATLLETGEKKASSLNSVERVTSLVNEAPTRAPIWGVALGPAISDWFKGWMPGRENIQMDWDAVFQKVDSLLYSVDVSDKIDLDMKMNCTSPEAASSLRQLLEGLRLIQQLAWQNQNPSRRNPFDGVVVESHDRRVELTLATSYADLVGAQLLVTP